MDKIISTLRDEARSYDRLVTRCENSLNFMRQSEAPPGWQRRELTVTMGEAASNADRIRAAIVELSGVTS